MVRRRTGDTEAARSLVAQLLEGESESLPTEVVQKLARSLIAGWGGLPLVGTAEQIVDQLVILSGMGVSGVALGWVDYTDGLGAFNEKVIPLMVEADLRTDSADAVSH